MSPSPENPKNVVPFFFPILAKILFLDEKRIEKKGLK
jgi:hypothetical protein